MSNKTKIQFDTVNGVQIVNEFDNGVNIIDQAFVMDDLKNIIDGEIEGAEVDDELLAQISEEYGIR